MQRFRFAACLALPVFLASSMVWADVPPLPDPCDGKKAGEACTLENGGAGACVTQTCSKLSYGSAPEETPDGKAHEPDHGNGPRSVDYDCVKCQPAPAAKPGPEAKPGPSDKKAPEATPAPKATTASESKSGCTVAAQGQGPWGAVVVLLGGAMLLRRRR